jgi:hypothetical protein
MADKDVSQSGGWKWRMLELAAGIFAPYYVPLPASAAALSNVASSATSVTLKAANAGRRGLIIFNDSTQVLYAKYGASASATSFTVKIAAGGYWEMPLPIFQGVVDGLWASADGNARVTEIS